jgi:hypothetical protein
VRKWILFLVVTSLMIFVAWSHGAPPPGSPETFTVTVAGTESLDGAYGFSWLEPESAWVFEDAGVVYGSVDSGGVGYLYDFGSDATWDFVGSVGGGYFALPEIGGGTGGWAGGTVSVSTPEPGGFLASLSFLGAWIPRWSRSRRTLSQGPSRFRSLPESRSLLEWRSAPVALSLQVNASAADYLLSYTGTKNNLFSS